MSDEVNEEEFLELVSALWTNDDLEVTENTLLRLRQRRERFRQEIPAVQSHPMYPDGDAWKDEYAHHAKGWIETNQYRARQGQYAWDGMILMSAYVALSQVDDDVRESELLDLAAIVIGAYEASRKRRAGDA